MKAFVKFSARVISIDGDRARVKAVGGTHETTIDAHDLKIGQIVEVHEEVGLTDKR